jgi:hypothetical protein
VSIPFIPWVLENLPLGKSDVLSGYLTAKLAKNKKATYMGTDLQANVRSCKNGRTDKTHQIAYLATRRMVVSNYGICHYFASHQSTTNSL